MQKFRMIIRESTGKKKEQKILAVDSQTARRIAVMIKEGAGK